MSGKDETLHPGMDLTDAVIREAAAEGRRVELVERGLQLRINKDGTKTWSLRYRLPDGRRRRLRLGVYAEQSAHGGDFDAEAIEPGGSPLTPEEAREVARVQRHHRTSRRGPQPVAVPGVAPAERGEQRGAADGRATPGIVRHDSTLPEQRTYSWLLPAAGAIAAALFIAVSALLLVGGRDSFGRATDELESAVSPGTYRLSDRRIEGEFEIEAETVLDLDSVSVAEGSSVTLKAGDLVSIGDGFEVGNGAQLTVVLAE